MDFTTPSSEDRSPSRGRTLHRVPPQPRVVSHANTRKYSNLDSSTPLERERRSIIHGCLTHTAVTSGTDPNTITSEFGHSLLEPLPVDNFRTSLSEELHRAATFDTSIDLRVFGDHKDEHFHVARFQNRHNPWTKLPNKFFAQMIQYLNIESHKSLRLTCQNWSVAMSKAQPALSTSAAVLLPAEIMEQIFIVLSPIDFNSARHTCRSWMRTSLESRLSIFMLKSGGWSGTVAADLKIAADHSVHMRSSIGNDEWFLSKRLATECSLSPRWFGHGVPEAQATSTGLRLTSQIDFSQFGVDDTSMLVPFATPTEDLGAADVHFTTSTCTKYLLAFKSCIIYIYALRRMLNEDNSPQPYGAHVELVSRLDCPDQVLAVSMDTSCRRYAVAALLRGAVGIVHDLDLNGHSVPWTSRGDAPGGGGGSHDDIHSQTLKSSRTFAFGDRKYPPQLIEAAFHARAAPFQTYSSSGGSFSAYSNLCQIDDPPRSVAICPQRRCVAFGCRCGIELHWTDALTGQDLNRWFPLLAPADHLFFMPTRDDERENSRKLRLISSAASPTLVKTGPQIYPNDNQDDKDDKRQGGNAENLTSTSTLILDPLTPPEYYTAVPLSDGRHLLLTLPDTGELCLVKDEPQSLEAEKLIRRFVFVGPSMADGGVTVIPHIYTAATELQWGVRVAAAYEDRLWLFIVPPDLFFERRKWGRRSDVTGLAEQASYSHHSPQSGTHRIEGAEIASIANLTSLALDGMIGDLTLWAFSADAMASIFQLAGSGFKAVTQRVALSDGTIVLTHDTNGDTVMADSPNSKDMEEECKEKDEEEDVFLTDDSDPPRDVDGDVFMTDYGGSHGDDAPDRPLEEELLPFSDGTSSSFEEWASSSVPCFPYCGHTYCKYLLYMDNDAFRPHQRSLTYRPPLFPSFHRTFDYPEEVGNRSITPSLPHLFESHANPSGLLSSNNSEPEDEGYASEGDEFEGCPFAIYVPPLSGQGRQDDKAERYSESLRESEMGTEDDGLDLDVIELCRCNCEIVGS